MQVAVESSTGLSRKIKVSVPDEQISQEINKRIKELTKTIKLKGFRPGKTPESVVKMRFGDSVREEVIRDVMWQTLQQALQQEKLYPAGMPKVEVVNFKAGEALEYIASFEVYPDVTLASVTNVEIEKPTADIQDDDINAMIEKLRQQNVKWKETDRAAELKDLLQIDFEGFIDDVLFEGGSAKAFRLELGTNRMIPGFEEPLIGVKAGETREITVNFPEDYHAKDLAGKPAKFVVTVHKVMESHLPELNEAFAKDLGVSDGTIEGLRSEVKDSMQRDLDRRVRENIKGQIVSKLLEMNEIDIPESLVDTEIQRIQKQFQRQFAMQTGQNDKLPELPREQVEKQARDNVTIGLLLSQWIKDKNVKVDGTRVRARIEEIASGYHQPEEVIKWYYSNNEALGEIEAAILEEQAIDSLLEELKVVPKPMSYDEIMNAKDQQKDN